MGKVLMRMLDTNDITHNPKGWLELETQISKGGKKNIVTYIYMATDTVIAIFTIITVTRFFFL